MKQNTLIHNMEDVTAGISGFFYQPEALGINTGPEFSLLNPSGTGPFVLYKCSWCGRITVMKAIRKEDWDNPIYLDMLRKEYEIGRRLNHPNIREYFSLTFIPELGHCIEMEWVDGTALTELLPQCRNDSGLCDSIAVQILDAVRFMHLKQVIHRDLKPDNILITANGSNAKIIDFSLSDSDSHLILKGGAGTAMYASPEQINCKGSDSLSDIYSLGVIFSQMSHSRRYGRAAERCTKYNPADRFRNVAELQAALVRPDRVRIAASVSAVIGAVIVSLFVFLWYRADAESDNAVEYVDVQTIDSIFQQATEMLEDAQ